MTMTREDSALMAQLTAKGYERDAELVGCLGADLVAELRNSGLKCCYDDRRAALDAAIYRYILACREHAKETPCLP